MIRFLFFVVLVCAPWAAMGEPTQTPSAPADAPATPPAAAPSTPADTASEATPAPAVAEPEPAPTPKTDSVAPAAAPVATPAPAAPAASPAPAAPSKKPTTPLATQLAAKTNPSPTFFGDQTLSLHFPMMATYRFEDASAVTVDRDGNVSDPDGASNAQIRLGATFKAMPSKLTRFSVEYEHDVFAGQFAGGATGETELVHGPLEGETDDTMRRAFAKLRLGPVFFGGGFTMSHWGMGLLANDGADGWAPGSAHFRDPRGGDRVRRGYVGLGPIPALDLLIMGGYDVVEGDDILLSDDTAEQFVGSVILQPGKPRTAGFYVAHRTQNHVGEKTTEVTIFDLYLNWTATLDSGLEFEGAFEGAVISGETGLGPNPDYPVHDVYQVGVAARAALSAQRYGGVIDFFYGSGDRNLDDRELNAFRADHNYELGMLLFRHVVGAHSARSPVRASDLELVGVPPEDLDRLPSRGAATNAWVIFPKGWFRTSYGLEVYGGPMLAFSDVEVIDPRNTRLAGGELRNGYDGQPGALLGTEFDLGLRYTTTLGGVGLTAGVEAAAFLPGSAFAGPDGETIDAVYGARAMTRVEL